MIWFLFGHLWWALPALVALVVALALAFGVWPLVLGTVGRLPPRAQALVLAVAVALIAGSGMYAKGKADGKAGCATAQEKLEAKADVKAASVAKESNAEADKAKASIRKESSDVQVQIREVVRTVPGACPAMPDELHDVLQRQVEAARAELQAGARDRDRGRPD